MPKIRGIKPETWSDETFVDLSFPARLLFIGLWNFACDNGHLEDRSKQIKMRVFPADDVNCAELLRELESHGRIVREGGYITVPTLTEHQRIDHRYFSTCQAPGCIKPNAKTGNPERETRRAPDGDTTSTQRAHAVDTSGTRGDCDCDGDCDCESELKGRAKRATQLPKDFAPNDTHQRIAAERGLNLEAVVVQFEDFHRAKGSTFKDWDAALRTWLRNERPPGHLRAVPAQTMPLFHPVTGEPYLDKSDDRR